MRGLIVGQGIAGTMLAWTLRQHGVRVTVADAGFPNRSSDIAAGIINPVTGKRYVKTWRFDDFYPMARDTYRTMESRWNIPVWHDQIILRILETPGETNDWSARMADAGYSGLLGERSDAGAWASLLTTGYTLGEIRSAARVDFPAILQQFRKELMADHLFIPETLRPEDLDHWGKDQDFIVFCEGYRGAANPFFPNLSWQLSKGEALLLRIQHPEAKAAREMVKKTMLLAPLGDGLFWAGASYNWTYEDNGPTDEEQNFLEERIKPMLCQPYEVVKRMGGVRPTVKDRRPFLGVSPVRDNVFIFNGLGTKGALLAPYWAEHLAGHILKGQALSAEVDIRRFEPGFIS